MKRLTNTTHYLTPTTQHVTRNASRITYHLKEHSHDHPL